MLMLFCAGNVVDDDFTVKRIFLVNPVCSLQSANVITDFKQNLGKCVWSVLINAKRALITAV